MMLYIVILLSIIPVFYFRKQSLLLEFKYMFLLTLKKDFLYIEDFKGLEEKYPLFYSIIDKLVFLSNSNTSFENIQKNSKTLGEDKQIELKKEFNKILYYGSKKEKDILARYLVINLCLHIYKKPYKFVIIDLLSKFLPKDSKKKVKDRQKEKINKSEYCIA